MLTLNITKRITKLINQCYMMWFENINLSYSILHVVHIYIFWWLLNTCNENETCKYHIKGTLFQWKREMQNAVKFLSVREIPSGSQVHFTLAHSSCELLKNEGFACCSAFQQVLMMPKFFVSLFSLWCRVKLRRLQSWHKKLKFNSWDFFWKKISYTYVVTFSVKRKRIRYDFDI